MKKLIAPLILIFLAGLPGISQVMDFNHFEGLKSYGQIPEDFTKLSSQKFNEDMENIETSTNLSEQRDKETFLLESNFLMDEILHSGRVIFGDPVTNYLNSIKDVIFKDNAEARNSIRIYTLLSNEVNAFTSDNGIVLVTTGLIAQAENEAQVAFILCHEFNHYLKKHAINNYVENKRIERGNGIYKSLGPAEVDLQKFKYSKELESEADETGYILFEKTNYSIEEAIGVFDVLLYSYLPFDEVEFRRDYFNGRMYEIPKDYFLDTLNQITAEEDYDDEESTHPNIKKRKEMVVTASKRTNRDDGVAFYHPKDDFFRIQKICRYQGCDIFLNDIQYEDAIYQAYLLQEEDPDNIFLKEVIAKALYGMSMYENAGSTPENHRYYKKVEGNSQQVFHVLYKMKDNELNVLALKYAWEYHLQDPSDKQMIERCKQLAEELEYKNEIELNDFITLNQAVADSVKMVNKQLLKNSVAADTTQNRSDETEAPVTETKSNKYQKIKKETPTNKKEVTSVDENISYWKYAFVEYLNNSEFRALFNGTKESIAEKNSSGKYRKPEYRLGVDEIVIIDPVYLSIDERSKNPIEFEAAESARLDLKNKITASADRLDLGINYIDYNMIDPKDVEAFNDLATFNTWIREKLDHLDEEVYMITSSNDDLATLSGKYGTDYFTWLGIVSFTEKEHNVGAKILVCIYLPLAPFMIYDLLTPDRNTYFFALVADAKTGKFEMEYFNGSRLNDNAGVQNSNIYYILQQIKTDPK